MKKAVLKNYATLTEKQWQFHNSMVRYVFLFYTKRKEKHNSGSTDRK